MEKTSIKKNFLKGIIAENPVFVSLLGMCPTLATTTSVESALGMGLLVLLCLIISNTLVSVLKRFTPQEIKIPFYIVVIATAVTIIKMLCNAFLPDLYQSLGVFISLIVVNCIIMARAESYASKNSVFDSFIDAAGMAVGFTMAIVIVAFFRELLGTGGLTFGVYLPLPSVSFTPLDGLAISVFTDAPGGFLVLAFILAFIANYSYNKQEKKKIKKEGE